MCMVRSKEGQSYVRLCAWYLDTFGKPKEARNVETKSTYRESQYVYFDGPDPPTSMYSNQPWKHYNPAKYKPAVQEDK